MQDYADAANRFDEQVDEWISPYNTDKCLNNMNGKSNNSPINTVITTFEAIYRVDVRFISNQPLNQLNQIEIYPS